MERARAGTAEEASPSEDHLQAALSVSANCNPYATKDMPRRPKFMSRPALTSSRPHAACQPAFYLRLQICQARQRRREELEATAWSIPVVLRPSTSSLTKYSVSLSDLDPEVLFRGRRRSNEIRKRASRTVWPGCRVLPRPVAA